MKQLLSWLLSRFKKKKPIPVRIPSKRDLDFESINVNIHRWAKLKKGWHEGQGNALRWKVVNNSLNFVQLMLFMGTPMPNHGIGCTLDGEIYFSWSSEETSMYLVFLRNGGVKGTYPRTYLLDKFEILTLEIPLMVNSMLMEFLQLVKTNFNEETYYENKLFDPEIV